MIVVKTPGSRLSEEDVTKYCPERIASYKKPKSAESVNSLPMNDMGKMLRRELRAKYWEERERKI